ncbi:hypothetical protein [Actinacidiphila soli]|uniref:hypothetical protein n=1 Tax=Actinacidiphila soli TaxID=2487275 RepID=UPI000FCC86AE|nr:hypothetical protein [Actinacidiphila soli]
MNQQAEADHGSRITMAGRDIREESHHYHAPGSGPGRRLTPRRAVLATALALVVIAAGIVSDRWYSDFTAADSAAAKRRGNAVADSRSTPFQVVVDGPDLSRSDAWAFILDHTLTPQETTALERLNGSDFQDIATLLRPLGARLLPEGGVPQIGANADPGLQAIEKRYESGDLGEGYPSHGDTYRLHFTSDHATPVTIESITTTDVSCRPTHAIAYLGERPQGEGPVPTIYLSLRDPAGTPAIEVDDAGNAVNSDYFAHNKIDVGQYTTPGDLNIEVGGVRHELCSWDFKVDYLTPSGKFSTVVDDNGRPFSVEDGPYRPVQDVQYVPQNSGKMGWADCAHGC